MNHSYYLALPSKICSCNIYVGIPYSNNKIFNFFLSYLLSELFFHQFINFQCFKILYFLYHANSVLFLVKLSRYFYLFHFQTEDCVSSICLFMFIHHLARLKLFGLKIIIKYERTISILLIIGVYGAMCFRILENVVSVYNTNLFNFA